MRNSIILLLCIICRCVLWCCIQLVCTMRVVLQSLFFYELRLSPDLPHRQLHCSVRFKHSGCSKHSWLLGAFSKWVSKSAISILGAYFFCMDAGCIW